MNNKDMIIKSVVQEEQEDTTAMLADDDTVGTEARPALNPPGTRIRQKTDSSIFIKDVLQHIAFLARNCLNIRNEQPTIRATPQRRREKTYASTNYSQRWKIIIARTNK